VSSSGSVVTLQESRGGRHVGQPTVIMTNAGAHFETIAAIGGVQYDISVAPT
jgi:hypothetical protein